MILKWKRIWTDMELSNYCVFNRLLYLIIDYIRNTMENENHNEIESLGYKIIMSGYALAYLDEVFTFYEQSEGTPQYESRRFQCEMLISEIYYRNELFEKSWIMDIALISDFPVDYPSYSNVIGRVKNTAIILNRVAEIKPYIFAFLTQSSCSWYGKIPVFGWYVEAYPDEDQDSLSILASSINNLALEMGVDLDVSQSFRENVISLVNEWERAGDALHQFILSYKRAGNEEKQALLEEYLKKETLKFYIDYVNKYYVDKL